MAEGAEGVLYVAEQKSTGRARLLRVLPVEGREGFARDALIGARIASEHVAEVVAAGVDAEAGFAWLALEHLDGEDLAVRLARRGPFERREALDVLRQICHALGAAHARSIVHGKLEPASVFIAKSARADVTFTVKVLDFGGTAPGSPRYRAPEQLRGEEVSAATDVWALGLVAFEMLAGKSYWLSEGDALEQEIKGGIGAMPSERSSVPEGFEAWLRKCCALDPRERFADASRAFAALAPLLDGPPKTDAARRRQLIVTGLGLAAVAVGSAIGVAYALVQSIAVETSVSYGDVGSSASAPSSSPPEASVRQPRFDPFPFQVPSAQTLEPLPVNRGTYLGPPDAGTTAYLTLMCIPGCDSVTVDGKNLGPSPIVRAELPPGVHGVVLRSAHKKTVTLAVTLAPGQRAARRILME